MTDSSDPKSADPQRRTLLKGTAGILAKYGVIKEPRDLVGTPVYSDSFPVRW